MAKGPRGLARNTKAVTRNPNHNLNINIYNMRTNTRPFFLLLLGMSKHDTNNSSEPEEDHKNFEYTDSEIDALRAILEKRKNDENESDEKRE